MLICGDKKEFTPSLWMPPRNVLRVLLPAVVFGVLEYWSIAKYQTPSTKLQTNLKFQYQMTKTGFEF